MRSGRAPGRRRDAVDDLVREPDQRVDVRGCAAARRAGSRRTASPNEVEYSRDDDGGGPAAARLVALQRAGDHGHLSRAGRRVAHGTRVRSRPRLAAQRRPRTGASLLVTTARVQRQRWRTIDERVVLLDDDGTPIGTAPRSRPCTAPTRPSTSPSAAIFRRRGPTARHPPRARRSAPGPASGRTRSAAIRPPAEDHGRPPSRAAQRGARRHRHGPRLVAARLPLPRHRRRRRRGERDLPRLHRDVTVDEVRPDPDEVAEYRWMDAGATSRSPPPWPPWAFSPWLNLQLARAGDRPRPLDASASRDREADGPSLGQAPSTKCGIHVRRVRSRVRPRAVVRHVGLRRSCR